MEKIEGLLGKILENQDRFDNRLSNIEDKITNLEEGQKRTEQRLTNLEEGQKRTEQRLTNLEEGQKRTEQRLTNLEEGQNNIKNEMIKFAVLQEKMQRDIELLVEGHQNILESMNRKFDDIRKEFSDRLDEVEAAVTNLGEDVKFIKHKEFQNEESIFKLKESLKIAK